MNVQELIEALDLEIDKRLYQLTRKDLTRIFGELLKYKDKKTLAKLISDNAYFNLDELIKALEKKERRLLFKILNEPEKEDDLRQPIANFLKNVWEYPYYYYEVDLPKSRRKIDVVGCEYSRAMGFLGENRIVAIEIKTKPTRSAIDSAFSQAKDYASCSDWAYVAVSPYVFLKYSKVLLDKVKKYNREIGLLLVDKLRVISEAREAKKTSYDDDKYEEILNYFKKK